MTTWLRVYLRTEDTVARVGGDEFVVLGEDLTGQRHAAALAGRIAQTLRSGISLDGHEVFDTTSIGVPIGGFQWGPSGGLAAGRRDSHVPV